MTVNVNIRGLLRLLPASQVLFYYGKSQLVKPSEATSSLKSLWFSRLPLGQAGETKLIRPRLEPGRGRRIRPGRREAPSVDGAKRRPLTARSAVRPVPSRSPCGASPPKLRAGIKRHKRAPRVLVPCVAGSVRGGFRRRDGCRKEEEEEEST